MYLLLTSKYHLVTDILHRCYLGLVQQRCQYAVKQRLSSLFQQILQLPHQGMFQVVSSPYSTHPFFYIYFKSYQSACSIHLNRAVVESKNNWLWCTGWKSFQIGQPCTHHAGWKVAGCVTYAEAIGGHGILLPSRVVMIKDSQYDKWERCNTINCDCSGAEKWRAWSMRWWRSSPQANPESLWI